MTSHQPTRFLMNMLFYSSINQKMRVRGARVLLQCIYIRPPHTHYEYEARGARETPERRFYSKQDLVYSTNKHVKMATARADPDIVCCCCISTNVDMYYMMLGYKLPSQIAQLRAVFVKIRYLLITILIKCDCSLHFVC